MARVRLESYLVELLRVAERAANIARVCRSERELFDLLVAEKTGEERNKPSRKDFKTLADVLVQETVRHYLGLKFPLLSPHVYGEESSTFTNALGESVSVKVCQTQALTEELLAKVLDGDRKAAHILARAVHEELPLPSLSPEQCLEMEGVWLDASQLGVWIDPIDGTGEYVKGKNDPVSAEGVQQSGLGCVTVLIGTFMLLSGEPAVGVVNQPFWRERGGGWEGRTVWGAVCGGKMVSNVTPVSCPTGRVAISVTESRSVVDTMEQAGWKVLTAAGAGYKLLCVMDGLVDCSVATQGSTFKWDTCGPHVVLKALGGDIVPWSGESRVLYHCPDDPSVTGGLRWRNSRGIIAYRDPGVAQGIKGVDQ